METGQDVNRPLTFTEHTFILAWCCICSVFRSLPSNPHFMYGSLSHGRVHFPVLEETCWGLSLPLLPPTWMLSGWSATQTDLQTTGYQSEEINTGGRKE